MRLACLWLCCAFLANAALAAAPNRVPPPNIVLITLDTTRADRMGFLGSDRDLTPNLDALAHQSSVFKHAYAQAPLTPTSHASILTGTYPQFHQVSDFRVPLTKDLPFLPEILRAHGYHTAAFVGSIVLEPTPSYAPGFNRGFDTYDAGFHYQAPGEDRYHSFERRGAEVVAHALSWLARHPKGPFFIWIHLYDAHDPYDPPEPYKTKYASEPYDGEIAYVDSAIGKFLRQMKLRGLYDGSIIAVMADHGESLGAHGENTHGIFLYDETIRVPLLIKLPHQLQTEKRIENHVELVDVLPTLLETVRISIPAAVQGVSLLPLIKPAAGAGTENAWRDRPAYAETDYPHSSFGWSPERSLRAGKYLYIQAPRRELYDQPADPQTEHNLAERSSAVADTLAEQLDTIRKKTSNSREAPKASVDPTAQEKLAALGYVTSSGLRKAQPDAGTDPKDKIEIANIVLRAMSLREQGQFEQAAGQLQEAIARDPGLPGAYLKLGNDLLDMQAYDQAVSVLRKAMDQDPDEAMTHLALAKALMGAGDFEGAVPELEFTVAKIPNLADAHIFLEMAYARTNRVAETIRECKTVLEFAPNHFGSYLILGRFLEISGDPDGAIQNLKKATQLDPKAPEPHLILAVVYDHMGHKIEAERERAVASRLTKAK